ncbi:hypothetical protein KIL84_004944 [Mauremys mutica]|uniref:Uncharacterized protein n=1 Tax=Mauremys mutica TaxID=74926 RepID=A0A9D3XPI0_9SAUR|nr:hypothetical protein KIL84_004944 [Mauremys mutica]
MDEPHPGKTTFVIMVSPLPEAQSDSARSKRLTGVGAFVLGLIVPAPGLLTCPRTKKGCLRQRLCTSLALMKSNMEHIICAPRTPSLEADLFPVKDTGFPWLKPD